jgi:hexosaminidase
VTLNPSNEFTFELLNGLLEEMSELFPDPWMHLGGDEVNTQCWREDVEVVGWLKKQGKQNQFNYAVQFFEKQLTNITSSLSKTIIRWEEMFGNSQDPNAAFQVWTNDRQVKEIAARSKKVLFSHGWYLNHNAGGGGCQSWRECYARNVWEELADYSLTDQTQQLEDNIWGGETCAWEMSEDHFTQRNLWLRLFAVSERLWSSKELTEIHASTEERLQKWCSHLVAQRILTKDICADTTKQKSVGLLDQEFRDREVARDTMICNRVAAVSGVKKTCQTKNCRNPRLQ